MMTPEEQIDQRIEAVFTQTGDEIIADMKALVAVNAPPSSDPGNPPHRRTGHLQAGIGATVEPPGPVLTIQSTAEYSQALEGGTQRVKARPFFWVTIEAWVPVVLGRLQDAFR